MSVKEPTPLEREIIIFQDKIQRMIDNAVTFHESMMRDEAALKQLLERIGEIPSIKRPDNEHKADS
jgi:hypothetical protein